MQTIDNSSTQVRREPSCPRYEQSFSAAYQTITLIQMENPHQYNIENAMMSQDNFYDMFYGLWSKKPKPGFKIERYPLGFPPYAPAQYLP